MTTIAAFCPFSAQMLFDANANPIPGGSISFFDAGTTNARAAYADAGLATSRGSSVPSDAFGRFPAMFLDVGAYKVVLADASDAQLAVYDGLAGGVSTGGGTTPVGTTIPTGFVMPAHTDDVVDGWLPLNGTTIGSVSSAASARAADDVQALFLKLWNKDPSLAVQGGRGLSATADWGANKTLALPDYRGRTVAGVDGMGVGLAGILTSLTTATPNQVGTAVGTESTTLSVAQLPAVAPTITIASAGAFTPTGTLDTQGNHVHSGTTGGANTTHTHSVLQTTGSIGVNTGGGGPCMASATTSVSTTGDNSDHSHNFTTSGAGSHSHNFTGAAVPAHTHTATASPLGSGNAHPNMQPSILAYWHIKL